MGSAASGTIAPHRLAVAALVVCLARMSVLALLVTFAMVCFGLPKMFFAFFQQPQFRLD
jgi:hypothetical protein